MRDRSKRNSGGVLWLLPVVFLVHDGEEVLTYATWLEAHRAELSWFASLTPTTAEVVRSLPGDTSQFAAAVLVEFGVFLAVTFAAWRARRPGLWLYAYAALLGGLCLHVGSHVAQAVVLDGYVPGLVGAVVAVVPGSFYVYKWLFRNGLLTVRSAVFSAAGGIVLFVPAAMLFHQIGRRAAE